ncbi:MAG: chromosomal replication initiator protein DnaA [Candidatus Scalinduaceae bacterium]
MKSLIDKKTWSSIKEEIKRNISSQQFATWFEKLKLVNFNNNEICILVPNPICKEWLENNYIDVISSVVYDITNQNPKVKFVIESVKNLPEYSPNLTPSLTNIEKHVYINKNYTFENFLVGSCNRLAHATALAVCESPGTAYNPLFIHGTVGLGKTHLLQAIYLKLQEHLNPYNILYLPCETFVNHYISTIKTGDWDDFRDKYRQIDVMLIDDIHFLANSQNSREEFFHTFNALYSRQKQIVLSSDCPPEEIPTIEERLISRFRWGLITKIDPPNFETSVAIIQRKAALLNLDISHDVSYYLAENVSSSIREIEGALLNICKYASINKCKIDSNLVKHVIQGFTKENVNIGIEKILNIVTKHFGIQLSQLHSKRKFKSITLPRQIAMYLARRLTNLSLEEIGGYMGGRDHTTVLHADEKIKKLKKTDRNISNILRRIEKDLIR